jgi:hypothetical protein
MVRGCLDWTERRPHVAGNLGSALLTALTAKGWLEPTSTSRALHLTENGRNWLAPLLDVDSVALRPSD